MEDLSHRICRSVRFDSLESANAAFRKPHLFAELRFDLSQIVVADIPKLILPEKIVFTCRNADYTNEERYKIYSLALDLSVNYIDLDFDIDTELLMKLMPKIKNSETKLILSQHNYSSTPDFNQLSKSTQKAFDLGADIVKIITMAETASDLETLYCLYQNFDNIIAFAMGDLGMVSRAKILTLGAPFTYAAYSNKELTAPGQLDYQQTADLYYMIKAESL